jgi:F-type H+-transporting ATPase subunit gamma
MSDTAASLRAKIEGADKLKSVVRTMKAMAASSIGQYETAVLALGDYERTVTLGLTACLRQAEPKSISDARGSKQDVVGAIVFGSDQGLVGQFNEVMEVFVTDTLNKLPGQKKVWVVGERLYSRLADAGLPVVGPYPLPSSVSTISQLVGRIQIECEAQRPLAEYNYAHVHLFHNQPQMGGQYQPVCRQLLPLDARWQQTLAKALWPTSCLPQAVGVGNELLRNLVREYLFISIFKACAESLASENASRLAAMQRAEKNIDELSTHLHRTFSRLRQNAIDEELFDVIAGFNALAISNNRKRPAIPS